MNSKNATSGKASKAAQAWRGPLPWVASGLMGAVAAVSLWQTYDLRSAPSAENRAVVDADASAEVQGAVTRALVGILSFDYSDPATTSQAAASVLTGAAKDQYATLYSSLQERAPGQQLVLSATVQVAAVKTLSEKEASLLVFVDQSSQRASDKEATYSAAQLAIRATKSGGSWKIADLATL